MHENSLDSYEQCKVDQKFTRLIHKIAKFYETWKPHTFTDRAVKEFMFKEGDLPFDDMNMVRPKITKLIKDDLLEESGKVNDAQTKRMVRQVRWKEN